MKIRGNELYVMMDALRGSLRIRDRSDLQFWTFSHDTREGILNDIIARMGQEEIEVTGFGAPQLPKEKEKKDADGSTEKPHSEVQ